MITSVKSRIEYSEEKNILLKATRGVNFEEIIIAIEKGKILADLRHRNKKKYTNQKILVVKIKEYVWAVPYVHDKNRGIIFLKTAYPSRVLTKKYVK